MNPKPGKWTTEFWAMLGTQVVGLLVLLGVIEPGSQETATTAMAEAVESVSALVSMGVTVAAYATSRGKAKAPAAPQVATPVFVPEPIAGDVNERGTGL
jgi:hypothetical protein